MPVRRIVAVCVLALALAAPVGAQQQTDARILKGVEQRAPDRIEHRTDGLSILNTYRLPEDARQLRGTKQLFPYIVYTWIGELTSSAASTPSI